MQVTLAGDDAPAPADDAMVAVRARQASPVLPAFPKSALFALALGTFAVGTEGFMIAAMLPRIASDLSVTISIAGQLVTVFTLVFAVSSPVLTALTGRFSRRGLLLSVMAVFMAGNILAALASGYWSLLWARVLLALAAGLYGPNANALAGVLVPQARRGRALAIVNGGFSLAVAIGVPVGAFIGGRLGWRMIFVGVAVLSAMAFIGLLAGIPKGAGQGLAVPSIGERLAVVRRPGALPALFVTTLWAVGGYSVYTFIAPFVTAATNLQASQLGYVLFCWGGSAFFGLLIGGYMNDKTGPRRVISAALILMAVALFSLSATAAYIGPSHALPAILAAAVAWGLAAWGFFPAQQARLIAIAGITNAPLILSLNGSFQYFGFSIGAALGAMTLAFGGVLDLGWVGGGCVVAAFLLFAVTDRRHSAVAAIQAD